MKNDKQSHLRAQVQKIEEKILAITGKNVEFNMEWTRSQRKCEQVEKLIWKRKHLLKADNHLLLLYDRILESGQTSQYAIHRRKKE